MKSKREKKTFWEWVLDVGHLTAMSLHHVSILIVATVNALIKAYVVSCRHPGPADILIRKVSIFSKYGLNLSFVRWNRGSAATKVSERNCINWDWSIHMDGQGRMSYTNRRWNQIIIDHRSEILMMLIREKGKSVKLSSTVRRLNLLNLGQGEHYWRPNRFDSSFVQYYKPTRHTISIWPAAGTPWAKIAKVRRSGICHSVRPINLCWLVCASHEIILNCISLPPCPISP